MPTDKLGIDKLVSGILASNKRAVAKAITILENDLPGAAVLLDQVFTKTGNAQLIGVTGPPGAGKSTLIEKITNHWLQEGKKIGIIAVDPSSPFTGGAILGDRIRMKTISSKKNVFIRSMATRGALGGLSPHIREAMQILDAAGMDKIIVETVGVGQSEIDIVKVADTVILVTVPEAGDDIQVIKSGIMEIGDVFVVNKADRPGANKMEILLKSMIHSNNENLTDKNVVKTVASESQGIDELIEVLDNHYHEFQVTGKLLKRKKALLELMLFDIIKNHFANKTLVKIKESDQFKNLLNKLAKREIEPYSALTELAEENQILAAILEGK